MEMDRTFAAGSAAIAIVLVALIVGISLWVANTNLHYYAAVNHCTDAGGMWMSSSAGGTCVRGIRQ